MFNPIIRGWTKYYGQFYKSGMNPVYRYINRALIRWVRRKYKRYQNHGQQAEHWLGRLAKRERKLFAHWQVGVLPTA
jgi:RNA-directed DNA polymerase